MSMAGAGYMGGMRLFFLFFVLLFFFFFFFFFVFPWILSTLHYFRCRFFPCRDGAWRGIWLDDGATAVAHGTRWRGAVQVCDVAYKEVGSSGSASPGRDGGVYLLYLAHGAADGRHVWTGYDDASLANRAGA